MHYVRTLYQVRENWVPEEGPKASPPPPQKKDDPPTDGPTCRATRWGRNYRLTRSPSNPVGKSPPPQRRPTN